MAVVIQAFRYSFYITYSTLHPICKTALSFPVRLPKTSAVKSSVIVGKLDA